MKTGKEKRPAVKAKKDKVHQVVLLTSGSTAIVVGYNCTEREFNFSGGFSLPIHNISLSDQPKALQAVGILPT